ncbi:hypothetical protein ACG0Z4_17000 [Enterocloster aldenensis]|uniref:hypothetical protein n=1 Tax=Enterocloster aldenensis TaxID=358742 RepID=UPI00402923A8
MSAVKLHKILSLSFSLVIVLLFPLTIYASTATPSEARPSDEDILIASSSNVLRDDFMESDDFDTLDVPSFMSSGDSSVSNTVDYSGVYMAFAYYDMSGRTKVVRVQVDDDGYASVGLPSDCARPFWFGYTLYSNALPSAGNYRMNIHFGSNTGIVYAGSDISFLRDSSNVAQQSSYTSVTGTYSSGDFNLQIDLSLASSVTSMNVMNYIKDNNQFPPFGGYVDISFTRLSNNAPTDLGSPGVDSIDRDIQQDISNNTAQQVEQGDTIIELIKNTIQTISSQLTAFWNQLAGEFTNLYNKMTQQHSEQLQADRDNTDDIIAADDANTNKVTTAIESHGNFIIEGLKKLFIPSDEYFKAYFDDLYSWFSERFGFLSFPIDLLLEVIDIFVNSSQTDCVLVLPSFTIMDNLLWPEMSFNLTEFLDTNFSFVVVAIKTVTSIYLVMAFVQLCEEKWNEVMMN